MLVVAEFLFISLLVIVLFMIFKTDSFSLRKRLRNAKAEEYWDGTNRRRHPRFPQSLEVTYSVIKKRPPEKATGKTVDISEGGLKLILDEKLLPGSSINLQISLPGSNHKAEATADVVWTEDASEVRDLSGKRFFYSGVKFSSLKDLSGKYFIDHIRSIRDPLES